MALSQRRRYSLTFCGLLLLLFLRRAETVIDPRFVVEDGRRFFGEQLVMGVGAIFHTYAGYLHLVPRGIALLASPLPFRWQPLAFSALSLIVVALVGALFSLDWYRSLIAAPGIRIALVFVCLSATNSSQLLGNITNLMWFLLLGGLMISVIPAEVLSSLSVISLVILSSACILISLSQPFVIILFPCLVWQLLRTQSRARVVPLVLLAGGVLQTLVFYASTHSRLGQSNYLGLPHEVFAAVANRVLLPDVLGERLTIQLDGHSRLIALAIVGAMVGAIAGILAWRGREEALRLLVCGYLVAFSAALAIGSRDLGAGFQSVLRTTEWGAERYFFLGSCMVYFLVAHALDAFLPRKAVAIGALVGFSSVSLISEFAPDQWRWGYYSDWPASIGDLQTWAIARRSCDAAAQLVVPTNPGWYIVLPALIGCDGSTIPDDIPYRDGDKVYLMSRGCRRPIPDAATLAALGFAPEDISTESQWASQSLGEPVPAVHCRKIRDALTGDDFIFQRGRRRFLPKDGFQSGIGAGDEIITLTHNMVAKFPLGEPIAKISSRPFVDWRSGRVFGLVAGGRIDLGDFQSLRETGWAEPLQKLREDDIDLIPMASGH